MKPLDLETIKEYYNRKELLSQKKRLQQDIIELTRQSRYRGVSICKHNTILALTYNGEVSHIITQGKNERGMINLCEVDKHLGVPRYEPTVAKEWMSEELVLNNRFIEGDDYDEMMGLYAKTTLSEIALRELVIKDKRGLLECNKSSLKIEAELMKNINKECVVENEKQTKKVYVATLDIGGIKFASTEPITTEVVADYLMNNCDGVYSDVLPINKFSLSCYINTEGFTSYPQFTVTSIELI